MSLAGNVILHTLPVAPVSSGYRCC